MVIRLTVKWEGTTRGLAEKRLSLSAFGPPWPTLSRPFDELQLTSSTRHLGTGRLVLGTLPTRLAN